MNLRTQVSSSDLFRGVVWSTALAASIAGIVLGGVVMFRHLPPLVTALISRAPDPGRPDGLAEVVSQHDGNSAIAKARFDKRSFFFDPPPPKPKPKPAPPPPPPPPPVDETPAAPPPPPAEYRGPKPYSILGDMVFFANKGTIKLGEERDGVKVLAINAPWSVKLGWERGEYEESVWDSSDKYFRNALADEGTEAKGLLSPDRAGEALEGIVGAGGASAPPGALTRPPGKPLNTPAGRAKAAAAEAADAAKAAEEAARAEGGGEEKAQEHASEHAGQDHAGRAGGGHRTPYTKEQIEAFDRISAAKALQEVSKAKNDPKLDEATKRVYQEEYDHIVAHLKNMNAQGGSKK